MASDFRRLSFKLFFDFKMIFSAFRVIVLVWKHNDEYVLSNDTNIQMAGADDYCTGADKTRQQHLGGLQPASWGSVISAL